MKKYTFRKYFKKVVALMLIVGIICSIIPTDNARASGYWEEQGLSEGHNLRNGDYYVGRQGITQAFKYGFRFYGMTVFYSKNRGQGFRMAIDSYANILYNSKKMCIILQ